MNLDLHQMNLERKDKLIQDDIEAKKTSYTILNEHKTLLIIYTGGTLGMHINEEGLLANTDPNSLYNRIREIKEFYDVEYSFIKNLNHQKYESCLLFEKDLAMDDLSISKEFLYSMPMENNIRLKYKIIQYNELIDSCNNNRENIFKIAQIIEKAYSSYDSFLIIHGTDTLEYTSSALPFLFENLAKCVIITGSQIPLSIQKNDAYMNLLGVFRIIATYDIPEVSVYFNEKWMRGNRIKKIDCSHLAAFDCDIEPFIIDDIKLKPNWKIIKKLPEHNLKFKVNYNLDIDSYQIFHLNPLTNSNSLKLILKNPKLRAIIVTTNNSSISIYTNQEIVEELINFSRQNKIIFLMKDCFLGNYKTFSEYDKKFIDDNKFIYGKDITIGGAINKLAHLLSIYDSNQIVKTNLKKNLRGEISVEKTLDYINNIDQELILTLLKNFERIENDLLKEYNDYLLYNLKNEILIGFYPELIKYFLENKHHFNKCFDNENKSPLINFSTNSNLEKIKFCYENGFAFDDCDLNNKDFLFHLLIQKKYKEIKFLVEKGYKTRCECNLINDFIHENIIKKENQFIIYALIIGFDDFESMKDEDKRNPLQTAIIFKNYEIIDFLVTSTNINIYSKDIFGISSYDRIINSNNDELKKTLDKVKIN